MVTVLFGVSANKGSLGIKAVPFVSGIGAEKGVGSAATRGVEVNGWKFN